MTQIGNLIANFSFSFLQQNQGYSPEASLHFLLDM